MVKILVGNKEQRSGYFEVSYTLTLDIPQVQQEALSKSAISRTTETRSGVASYKDGTELKEIQEDLVSRYSKAQEELNNETKLSFYGLTWDGKVWA